MSAGVPPVRSHAQRAEALGKANAVRVLRATDKQQITARQLDARTLLLDPPDHWCRAKVVELLLAVPAIGRTKTERVLDTLAISPAKTMGGMTADQRRRLAAALDPFYATRPLLASAATSTADVPPLPSPLPTSPPPVAATSQPSPAPHQPQAPAAPTYDNDLI